MHRELRPPLGFCGNVQVINMNWGSSILELLLPQGFLLINELMYIEVTGVGKDREGNLCGAGR